MKLALITGVYGNYDPIHSLPDDHGFDEALCVTDDETLVSEGWNVVVRSSPLPARMACKYPKMLPWKFTDCDAAIWLDASFSVNAGGGLSKLARAQLLKDDFIVFKHPEARDCIQQEMAVCYTWPKYNQYPMKDQVKCYFAEGMPPHFGLWAAGMVGWRFTNKAKDFGNKWHAENAAWSIQDQISLPYLLWREHRIAGEWDCHEFLNPYITYHGHARFD